VTLTTIWRVLRNFISLYCKPKSLTSQGKNERKWLQIRWDTRSTKDKVPVSLSQGQVRPLMRFDKSNECQGSQTLIHIRIESLSCENITRRKFITPIPFDLVLQKFFRWCSERVWATRGIFIGGTFVIARGGITWNIPLKRNFYIGTAASFCFMFMITPRKV